MRFQILQGWSIGQHYFPSGTIFPNDNPDWNRIAQGRTPPLHSLALDQEAADKCFTAYPDLKHYIHVGEGVKRR